MWISVMQSWCGSDFNNKNQLNIDVWNFVLSYGWNVELTKVYLKNDDLSEIIDLYQEDWDNVWYRDSLLIAERYFKWSWIDEFAVDNLTLLTNNWLTLNNIKKTNILTNNSDTDAILMEYQIVWGLVPDLPLLYVAQLFVPDNHTIRLVSYITEDSSMHKNIINIFKNIN